MAHETIEAQFGRMGARVEVIEDADVGVRVDIRHGPGGEYFEVRHGPAVRVSVPEVRVRDPHLLLVATRSDQPSALASTFLCGHDERAWFVAAVPEGARARGVQEAKDALKPPEVWDAMRELGVPMRLRDRRRTAAFVRQGEWFFIPRPRVPAEPWRVLKDEPIRRGAGKPHVCQLLFRIGGQVVYVNDRHPNGLTFEQREALPKGLAGGDWRPMQRDAEVYARGSVRHPDHKTVWLASWHRVVMNTETRSLAMSDVAFLD